MDDVISLTCRQIACDFTILGLDQDQEDLELGAYTAVLKMEGRRWLWDLGDNGLEFPEEEGDCHIDLVREETGFYDNLQIFPSAGCCY